MHQCKYFCSQEPSLQACTSRMQVCMKPTRLQRHAMNNKPHRRASTGASAPSGLLQTVSQVLSCLALYGSATRPSACAAPLVEFQRSGLWL